MLNNRIKNYGFLGCFVSPRAYINTCTLFQEIIRSELKAETMMTSLLKEKLYSKEVEIEELQAEVAAALRGNEILRCELQNSTDNISCLTHRLKDLQLQVTFVV